jgi:hypothetical protein
MKSPTASSVSAAFRRAGWNPVSTRNREGLRVTNSVNGVRVCWDVDVDNGRAREVIQAVREEAQELGYVVGPLDGFAFYVLSKLPRAEV